MVDFPASVLLAILSYPAHKKWKDSYSDEYLNEFNKKGQKE